MRVKSAARSFLINAANHSGLIGLMERRATMAGVTVLMYHRVLPDDIAHGYPLRSLAMPITAFREQVQWLSKHCRVLPLKDAISAAETETAGPRGIVAITFDDGYTDNYEHAAPIMEESGVRGTFFITADIVGTDKMLWFDRAALAWNGLGGDRLKAIVRPLVGNDGIPDELSSIRQWMQRLKSVTPAVRHSVLAAVESEQSIIDSAYRLMKIEDVADLNQRGHEIGSHSSTHPLLPQLTDAELRVELFESKRKLAAMTGTDIVGIAYPNGDVDERVARMTRDSGYRYGVITTAGRLDATTDPMRIPRLDMNPLRVASRRDGSNELAFRAQFCQLFGRWT